jgi:hypothetical protein
MNRRSFLKTSALTTAAVGAAASMPKTARAAVNANPPSRFVFMNLGGGWDSTYVVDPKPGFATVSQAPGEMLQYANIQAWNWRPKVLPTDPDSNVKLFFDAYGDRAAIVKGINLRTVSHDIGAQRIYTGRQGGTHPDMATMIAFSKGFDLPVPYMILNGPAWAGPYGAAVGRVGETGQLRLLIDPAQADFLSFRPDVQDEIDIEAFHLAVAQRQEATRGSVGYNRNRIEDFMKSQDRADRLRDLGKNINFGGTVTTAIEIFRYNLSMCVMMNGPGGYDTHGGNIQQGPMQDQVFGQILQLFQALEAEPDPLNIGDNMLEHTCFILTSEFTRTPMLNGGQGKDHWPVGAAFVCGAGVANRQVGETGEGQVALPLNLTTGEVTGQDLASMSSEMWCAGVLSLAGVDPYPFFQVTPPLSALHY